MLVVHTFTFTNEISFVFSLSRIRFFSTMTLNAIFRVNVEPPSPPPHEMSLRGWISMVLKYISEVTRCILNCRQNLRNPVGVYIKTLTSGHSS
ncbi:protein phosphatase 3, catalytic subunit, beta isoform, isoform CRA_a [Rattus norvegicus]|uniref:Protein phosphatase 3, catalytic subunit, beta isoform, isoform CRA_a n=1 Tax=Rattus norvegicus TaxID=10116 RepID=A6KKN5_RAT|nr:protein phosphatase 3, catalytic subunit, beta isoform, isoform CRA_a [Rattus norvegicus]